MTDSITTSTPSVPLHHTWGRKERAQTMVEFALALPVFLLILFGIIEVGRAMIFAIAVNTAAREGARYGAASGAGNGGVPHYADCQGIHAAAERMAGLVGIQDSNNSIIISYDNGPASPHQPSNYCRAQNLCKLNENGSELVNGDRIIVSVCATFQPVVPLVNLPAFDVSSTSKRTIVKNIRNQQ